MTNSKAFKDGYVFKRSFSQVYFYTWWYQIYFNWIYLPFKNTIHGISNLIKWFPTIWMDADWDSSYIWKVLKKKIEFQRKYLIKNDKFIDTSDVDKYMKICVKLIDKIEDDYYSVEYQDYHKLRSEFIDIPNSDDKELKMTETSENFDDYFAKYKNSCRKLNKNFRSKSEKAMYLSDYNQKKCVDLLFKIIKEKINTWWD